jgi:hypothetical protein
VLEKKNPPKPKPKPKLKQTKNKYKKKQKKKKKYTRNGVRELDRIRGAIHPGGAEGTQRGVQHLASQTLRQCVHLVLDS